MEMPTLGFVPVLFGHSSYEIDVNLDCQEGVEGLLRL